MVPPSVEDVGDSPGIDSDIFSSQARFLKDGACVRLSNNSHPRVIRLLQHVSVRARVEMAPRSSDVVNSALFVMDASTTSLIHAGVVVVWKTAQLFATLRVMWNFPSRLRQNLTWNGHFSSTQATQKRDLPLCVTL